MSSSTRSSSDWTWVTLGSGLRWTEVPSAPGGRSGVPSSSLLLLLELELELEELLEELELPESSPPGSFAGGAVGNGWSSLSDAGAAGFVLLLGAGASGAVGALRDFGGSPGNGKGSSVVGCGLAGVQGFAGWVLFGSEAGH